MQRREFLAGAASVSAVAVAGCSGIGGAGTPTPAFDIGMRATAFVPAEFETTVGSTVVWRNTNSRAHTVTAYEDSLPAGAEFFASGGFASESAARDGYVNGLKGAILSDDTYEHTFRVAGEYPYFCIPHERGGMVGTIRVTD